MRVLIINGSPRVNGNTSVAIKEIEKVFKENNIEYDVFQIGNKLIRGCQGCNYCKKQGKCVFNDEVNKIIPYFEKADGLIISSPVYYGSANGTLISFLDRLFYCSNFDKTMKVGASIVVARRSGCSATFDELNKYFTISNMPICSSQYWNNVHGGSKGEASQDLEGLQTMRTLAKNMIFLIKAIQLGKKEYGLPEKEERVATNFIR